MSAQNAVIDSPVSTAAACPHAAAAPHTPLPDDALERARAVTKRPGGGPDRETGSGHIGILLTNHGSRAPMWRRLLLDVHAEVADELLAIDGVGQVRTAFMEYTEPSIATQLRAFDEAGISEVLVIPLLLTISDHSFDDIPAIAGQRTEPELIAGLADENIEVYHPRASVTFSPLLDFSGLVRTNLARRVRSILGLGSAGVAPDGTGLVLVGYGSAEYDDDWNAFFDGARRDAETDLGIAASAHAWCGHLVDYRRAPTIEAINAMLERTETVIVMPQLVSYDPMFQERIIGRAVKQCADPSRVLYGSDSILPEPEVGRWVVRIAQQMLAPAAR